MRSSYCSCIAGTIADTVVLVAAAGTGNFVVVVTIAITVSLLLAAFNV